MKNNRFQIFAILFVTMVFILCENNQTCAEDLEPHRMGNIDTMNIGNARMIGNSIEISSDRFVLKFLSDGTPSSLKLIPSGKEIT